jgi:transposase
MPPALGGKRLAVPGQCVPSSLTVRKVAGGGYRALIGQIRAGGRSARSTVPIRPQRRRMGGAEAASSACVLDGSPAEVATPRDGGGDLLPRSVWLCMADAAAALPAIDAEHRSHGVMSAQRTGPTVHAQLTRWRRDGTLKRLHDALREHTREKAGRAHEPSAAVIDSQTARATGVGGPGRGFDAGKKTFGQKAPPTRRRIGPDPLGPHPHGVTSTIQWERGRWSRRRRLQSCLASNLSGPMVPTPALSRRG